MPLTNASCLEPNETKLDKTPSVHDQASGRVSAEAVIQKLKSLSERLQPRIAVERQSEQSGRSFRRHATRERLEHRFVKPVLKFGLQCTALYKVGQRNALELEVKRHELYSEQLPPEFDGFRVLHLSDLHIDSLPGLPKVVAGQLRSIEADLCVMTGDYRFRTEGPCHAAITGMRTVVDSIVSKHGIYATLGNHDPSAIAPALVRMGIRMLVNDAASVTQYGASLQLVGVDDSYDYQCHDLQAAMDSVPEDSSFKILLAHTPDLYAQAAEAGIQLYLCGHTHAGQIRLPFIGSVISNSEAPKAYTSGLWKHGPMYGYTSAGVGCSMLPIRFGCPPEITVFTLRRKAN